MKIKHFDKVVFDSVSYIVISFLALLCLLPFILLLSGSITEESQIVYYGYGLIPKRVSFEAYKLVFMKIDTVLRAYGVTIFTTLISTTVGLIFSASAGYALSRSDFEWRNKFALFMYFTTLFSGGLVPTYILFLALGLKNNLLALVFPHLFTAYNIFILRNFMKSIPAAISESAQIDGANDLVIFIKLILPLSKPALATIGLFIALGSWNEWYNCMLFISNDKLQTLQYYLYNLLSSVTAAQNLMGVQGVNITTLPAEGTKLAMTVIAMGPIVLAYPFIQKYFVQGITIGSVKG